MAQINLATIRKLRGYLVLDPTDLSADFPHGGTALGMIVEGYFLPGISSASISGCEYGGAPVGGVLKNTGAKLVGAARGFDADMTAALWPITADSGTTISGRSTGTGRAGLDLMTKSGVILFSPVAVDDHEHIIFYNAMPAIDESARLAMSMKTETVTAFAFHAVQDSTGRDWDIGLRSNLTL